MVLSFNCDVGFHVPPTTLLHSGSTSVWATSFIWNRNRPASEIRLCEDTNLDEAVFSNWKESRSVVGDAGTIEKACKLVISSRQAG
jgi:hypothetical protein